ncbi:proline--tRNA ligase [Desulfobulbus oligotrophicus]|jgi:prolyl-tRNA synthetase|uniref:Proline--tRNA ligase n=1 Tax=Desulfobulbus oligotrophicus TaxID=1909699 RepID=A0A7T6AQS3_9BACT|nr:proline--tRNA ligase [Desulfobulbus oligotrophicus]MDY0390402.1 proline--tRNA ligase [Desulfobulbus oligotrophicus]QQG65763.1 proline--tRNA ligase [Desulfobulbus oligotrophicus]
MRYSQMLLPTTRETPAEAEVISHQLLVRGGFIRKLTSGMYTYLPLGVLALQRVANIVREEMNRAGAQEILMPMVQPGDLWMESGRWKKYGPELLRFRDRHDRDYCLGPTHEEVVTDIARRELHSYRQLPVNLYQIQTKFRDEIRPRFGLMRGREFMMKDAYSFDSDDSGANLSYETMRQAYVRIFQRCGLEFRAVEADSGTIGGSFSHEFMVLAEAGEDTLVICDACLYAANVEKAAIAPRQPVAQSVALMEMTRVATPGMKQVDTVADFLSVNATDIIKTMIYQADGVLVAALVRGDRKVQTVKLKNLLGAGEIESLTDEQVWQQARLPLGYVGPVGLPLKIIADQEVMAMINAVAGANEKGYHYTGVNPGRDFQPAVVGDLRQVAADDSCPLCAGRLRLTEGIEVGHIFKLGTSYSEVMKASFQDSDGLDKPFIMGCYGIGVSRVVAAAIEQNHDDRGIVFPVPLAPFQVIILNLGPKEDDYCQAAERLYTELRDGGLDVLYDDRDERPGSKFNDADLIGIPFRLTVGKTFAKEGKVELKIRKTGETRILTMEAMVSEVTELVKQALSC